MTAPEPASPAQPLVVIHSLGFIHKCWWGVFSSVGAGIIAHMFDTSLPDPAALRRVDDAALVGAISGWMQASAAAEARALAGIAELVRRRCTDEHPDWACDDWDAAAAEVSAALTVSHGRASGRMDLAVTLRDQLPKVGALFLAGTHHWAGGGQDRRAHQPRPREQAWARLDEVIADRAAAWGSLSDYKLTQAVDVWVDQIDPAALHRTRTNARNRDVIIGDPDEKSGTTEVRARLLATDADLFDRRLKAMAPVCVRTIRARWPSAAQMRWARWAPGLFTWHAPAVARHARPLPMMVGPRMCSCT